jgi:hypothetical protein
MQRPHRAARIRTQIGTDKCCKFHADVDADERLKLSCSSPKRQVNEVLIHEMLKPCQIILL